MVCEGINSCKTGISKIDGQRYRFDYMQSMEVPIPHEKKVWKRRKYICPRCDRTITNGSKSKHNKICN